MSYSNFSYSGNKLKYGTFENIAIDNGRLTLEENADVGEYISDVIETKGFSKLVMSWNAMTGKGNYLEICIRVKKDSKFSKWFSYGIWNKFDSKSSEKDDTDDIAILNIDLLTSKQGLCDGLQYKIKFIREMNYSSPILSRVNFAISDNDIENKSSKKYEDIDIDVTKKSQMLVDGIGKVICSPTSLYMNLNHLGSNIAHLEVCGGVKDHNRGIYGNWSFNVAYAGELGFKSSVRFLDIDDMYNYIDRNIPIVASIKTQNIIELEGSPQIYKNGHLVLVRGFEFKNGNQYIIVNDPASKTTGNVKRAYKLEQFEKCFRNVCYVIEKN